MNTKLRTSKNAGDKGLFRSSVTPQRRPYVSVEEPKRAGSFPTLNLSQIDHKGLKVGCSLTQLNERVIQTSRRSHTSTDLLRATFSRLGAQAPRVTSESKT